MEYKILEYVRCFKPYNFYLNASVDLTKIILHSVLHLSKKLVSCNTLLQSYLAMVVINTFIVTVY